MRGLLRSISVAAAGAGIVVGASSLSAPLHLAPGTSHGPAATAHTQPVTRSQVICPGPESLGVAGLLDSGTQVSSVTAVAAPETALPSSLAEGLGLDTSMSPGTLEVGGLPSGGTWAPSVTARGHSVSGKISVPQSALVTGAGALAPGLVATQRSWVRSGDNAGLFTAACMPAASSSWLIAGGAEPGRRERLVLTNPGPNPVTVDLAVIGVSGPVQSANGRGLVVGPHQRTVVLLDAIAGSEPSPVVHVIAQGGEVAAVLSDTWLDGVVPRGGDDATPVAAPAREQVIAGVAIAGRATLRVGVPGDDEAVVEVRVLTAGGPKALPANGVMRLTAHSTKDLDLSALPPDAYAVQVRADVPVVAAAMVDRRLAATATPSDLAWSGASAPITTVAGMAVRGPGDTGLSARLYLAATDDPASVVVTTAGADGKVSANTVAVAADSVSTLPLDGVTSVWVTAGTGTVRAAVATWAGDPRGVALSVTPMTDLTLTTTSAPLRELRD